MFNRWSILLFLLAIMACLASCGQKIKDSVAPLNTSVQYPTVRQNKSLYCLWRIIPWECSQTILSAGRSRFTSP